MERLKYKIAIITGAGSGIGAETAKLFAAEGASVVITDINEDKLNQTAALILASGGNVIPIVHDVASEEDWKTVVAKTIQEFGAIHILFNNAGIETDDNSWENMSAVGSTKIISVNLTSQFLGIKAVADHIKKSGGGSIINISSTAGLIATDASPAYTGSKGGSRMLTKSAAKEYASDNIRINSIHPGLTLTELTMPLKDSEEGRQYLQSINPMKRAGSVREIANVVLFLASNESSYMTGTELVVDGGQVIV